MNLGFYYVHQKFSWEVLNNGSLNFFHFLLYGWRLLQRFNAKAVKFGFSSWIFCEHGEISRVDSSTVHGKIKSNR